MKTLVVSTEGQSEDAFVKTALQPHLQAYGVYAKSILVGTGRGRTGGWNKFGDLIKGVQEVLHSPASRNAFVTTMYDFSDITQGFPDYESIVAQADKYLAVAQAELVLQSNFPKDRFIPYFQLHQFESLIFTSPQILLQEFPEAQFAISILENQKQDYNNNSELVNSINKPSYRIAEALGVDDGSFKGLVIGNLAAQIGIPFLRQHCRHFNEWLTKLETLA